MDPGLAAMTSNRLWWFLLSALLVVLLMAASSAVAAEPQCSNRLDDNGDGLVDYPADPGCTSGTDNTELGNPPADGWIFCANEHEFCAFSGTQEVRYGANGTYYFRRATDGIMCNNATFGDPLRGVFKHCDIRAVTAAAPSGYPASFFTGPAGNGILLPAGGYPSTRTWVGASVCCGTFADGNNILLALEQDVGRKLDIRSHFNNGTCIFQSQDSVVYNGWVPVVTFAPNAYVNEISNGGQDSCFKTFAQGIAAQSHRVIVRLLHEFNGTWFRYSFWRNSNGTTRRATPAEFKAAWERIVGIFRQEGAVRKAALMISYDEGHYGNPGDGFDETLAYPGHEDVDWVSSDGYNHNASGAWCGFHAGWCEFAEIFTHGRVAPTHTPVGVEKDFRGVKPYAVAETGTCEFGDGGAKRGQWHRNAGSYITNHMPGVYAYIYFDVHDSGQGNPCDGDWRIRTSAESLTGFRDMVNMPRFSR
jgi:Glycosyl hydrolase family 26